MLHHILYNLSENEKINLRRKLDHHPPQLSMQQLRLVLVDPAVVQPWASVLHQQVVQGQSNHRNLIKSVQIKGQ